MRTNREKYAVEIFLFFPSSSKKRRKKYITRVYVTINGKNPRDNSLGDAGIIWDYMEWENIYENLKKKSVKPGKALGKFKL